MNETISCMSQIKIKAKEAIMQIVVVKEKLLTGLNNLRWNRVVMSIMNSWEKNFLRTTQIEVSV